MALHTNSIRVARVVMSGILLDDIQGFEVLTEACTTLRDALLQLGHVEHVCVQRPEALQYELSLLRSVLPTLREASHSLRKTMYALKSRLVQQKDEERCDELTEEKEKRAIVIDDSIVDRSME